MDSTNGPRTAIAPIARPSPVRRARVLLVLAGFAAISLLSPLAPAAATGLPTPPSTPTPPPLPSAPVAPPVPVPLPGLVQAPPVQQPQPGLAPTSCQLQPATSSPWSLLASSASLYQATADPYTGCLYRATDGQTLQRSSDDGTTWQTIFHDDARGTYSPTGSDATCSTGSCVASTSPFTMSGVVVPRADGIEVSEQANGDGLVRSQDQGRTWTLSNNGLAGQSVERIIPSTDARISYAIAGGTGTIPLSSGIATAPGSPSSSVPQLYRSEDGEKSWSAATLPGRADQEAAAGAPSRGQVGSAIEDGIQVDPTDPSRLFGAFWYSYGQVTAQNNECGVDVFTSRDAGASWEQLSTIGTDCPVQHVQLVVIRSQRHQLRLALAGRFPALATAVVVSDDGGKTWQPSAVPLSPVCPSAATVQDAHDGDHLLFMDPCNVSWISQDGFDHAGSVPAPPIGAPKSYTAALPSQSGGFYSGAFGSPSLSSALATQQDGSFLVNLVVDCSNGVAPPGSSTVCAANGTYSGNVWTLWRYAPPQSVSSVTMGMGGAMTPPPGTPASGLVPSRALAQQAAPCTIPAPANTTTAVADHQVNQVASGSLTFDGYELLYTHLTDTGGSTPPHYAGLIHAMAPGSCGTLSDIRVEFDANDVSAWAAMNGIPPPSSVIIDTLSYDARCNCIWATLADPNDFTAQDEGLFEIRVANGATSPRDAKAQLMLPGSGCQSALAYDQFRDAVWTCPPGQPTLPSEISAADGSQIPTCMTLVGATNNNSSAGVPGNGMSTWTVGGRHHLYVASEDDSTVWDYDPDTCALQQTYTHQLFAEPAGENEQMACDPLTFGPDGIAGLGPPSTVLWLRDAQGSFADSFAVPDAACPLSTATTYSSPTPVVAQRSAAVLCATLQQLYPGGTINLPGMPISFSLVGPTSITVPVRATTLGNRSTPQPSCVTWPADVPAGQYTVAANFDPTAAHREAQYRGSDGTGTLVVLGRTQAQVGSPRGFVPPVVQPAPPANGPPASDLSSASSGQSEAVTQAQVQAQAQAQSQAQSQAGTQSVAQAQPGIMVQRERQAQVATAQEQLAQPGKQSQSLLAARRTPVPVVAAGLMMGFGLLARRPRRAMARSAVRGASDRPER